MKTYSKRSSRPIRKNSRGEGDDSERRGGRTTTKLNKPKESSVGSSSSQSSARVISTPSGLRGPPPATSLSGPGRALTEHQLYQEQQQQKAAAVARELRQSMLSSVPVCSLGKSASASPAGGGNHGDTGASAGGGTARRSFDGDDDAVVAGSSPLLGARKLLGRGGGATLEAGGKGRRQQGFTGKKRSSAAAAGVKATAGTRARKEQTFLDFGQRDFGQRILCPRCDMLYVRGAAEDEARHASLCAKTARGVEFAGWKQMRGCPRATSCRDLVSCTLTGIEIAAKILVRSNESERVKARFPDDGGRVVEIRNGDPAAHLAKLRDVERLMDAEMGFAPGGREEAIAGSSAVSSSVRRSGEARRKESAAFITPPTSKKIATTAFLYVRQKRVLGCVVAQRIKTARRVLQEGARHAGGSGSTLARVGASPPSLISLSTLKVAGAPALSHGVRGGDAEATCSPPKVVVDRIVSRTTTAKAAAREDISLHDQPRSVEEEASSGFSRGLPVNGERHFDEDGFVLVAPTEDRAGRTSAGDHDLKTPPAQGVRGVYNGGVAEELPRIWGRWKSPSTGDKGKQVRLGGGRSLNGGGFQDLRVWSAGGGRFSARREETVNQEEHGADDHPKRISSGASPKRQKVVAMAVDAFSAEDLSPLTKPPNGSCVGGGLLSGGGDRVDGGGLLREAEGDGNVDSWYGGHGGATTPTPLAARHGKRIEGTCVGIEPGSGWTRDRYDRSDPPLGSVGDADKRAVSLECSWEQARDAGSRLTTIAANKASGETIRGEPCAPRPGEEVTSAAKSMAAASNREATTDFQSLSLLVSSSGSRAPSKILPGASHGGASAATSSTREGKNLLDVGKVPISSARMKEVHDSNSARLAAVGKNNTFTDSTNVGGGGAAAMKLSHSTGRGLGEGENIENSCGESVVASTGSSGSYLRSWSMGLSSSSEASPPRSGKDSPKPLAKAPSSTPMLPSVLVCEEEDIPAVVGILQIWVHERSRRQGVATKLVDTVREKMVYGVPLRRDQVAFSQPTRDGFAFATQYTAKRLLVY